MLHIMFFFSENFNFHIQWLKSKWKLDKEEKNIFSIYFISEWGIGEKILKNISPNFSSFIFVMFL